MARWSERPASPDGVWTNREKVTYPDTQNIYRLMSPECADTQDIIIAFYRDRDNKFGFANSTQVAPGLRSICSSLVLLAVNHVKAIPLLLREGG
ncbi:hypothetical protein N7465_006759 [Penicillium sp. CMV-2018d]|nr:hypothetical protein N7465_006759 [Penicillium sp. CMV-2018d]